MVGRVSEIINVKTTWTNGAKVSCLIALKEEEEEGHVQLEPT
jgi:hypothetical protein